MLSDTKILPLDFDYREPHTLGDALGELGGCGSRARLLAGGTDLLVKIKRLLLQPEILINIRHVPELCAIRSTEGGLSIGAAVSLAEVEHHPMVRARYGALHEALRSMAAPAVRNMGTIGGNLANASPAADTAPPLLALDASLGLQSVRGTRQVPLDGFFKSPGITILEPDELIREIRLPAPVAGEGSAFLKLGRVSADIAKISVAVYLRLEGLLCTACLIAFGAVAATPIRTPALEQRLVGSAISPALLVEVAREAREAIRPIDDVRSKREYRQAISSVLLEEALRAAWIRAGGEPC